MKLNYKSEFIANHPFHIHIRFAFGEIEFVNVYQIRSGVNQYHQWQYIDGVYINWGKPVEFNKIQYGCGSLGCHDYEAYIICETQEQFEAKIQDIALRIMIRYKKQLEKEAKTFTDAVDKISETINSNS